MRITVIGTGYLGAVHAACMASIGHEVLGVDSDTDKIAELAAGRVPFFEPGLADILGPAVRSGQLRFGVSYPEAGQFGQIHFICVGTPQLAGSYAADVSAVDVAVERLVPECTRDSLIVGKSTVPVGTAARLADVIEDLAPDGCSVELAWNPEFLRQGTAVRDTLHPERLVVGVASDRADAMLRLAYAPMISAGTPYISTDLSTAEMVKVSANAFLATKVSFINVIADICDVADADVVTLAQALGLDSRIGSQALAAGLGFGGGCLAKDVRALAARAAELGAADAVAFLGTIDGTNAGRRRRAIDIARMLVGGSFRNQNVAVLGVAFKPDTDDVRDSPALAVARAIDSQGASVRVHDPQAIENARARLPHLSYVTDVEKACEGADLVLHLTEWDEYSELDPVALRGIVRNPRIFDARNVLPLDQWRAAGWTIRAFGRRFPEDNPDAKPEDVSYPVGAGVLRPRVAGDIAGDVAGDVAGDAAASVVLPARRSWRAEGNGL